jgi:hypothetical protein
VFCFEENDSVAALKWNKKGYKIPEELDNWIC